MSALVVALPESAPLRTSLHSVVLECPLQSSGFHVGFCLLVLFLVFFLSFLLFLLFLSSFLL